MRLDSEEKFAHLLQPIRDVASNWNIDIANELEEYLEVLENITFSFQGAQSLNFAEAALVIQGSACVYSKKVEYLHSLVYQALEFVAERKIKAVKSRRQAGRATIQEDDDFNDDEHFLNLDDTIEDAPDSIDLDEDGQTEEFTPLRIPAILLALDTDTIGKDGDGEAGQYRIANYSVHHPSGALLFEARDGFYLDENLSPLNTPPISDNPARYTSQLRDAPTVIHENQHVLEHDKNRLHESEEEDRSGVVGYNYDHDDGLVLMAGEYDHYHDGDGADREPQPRESIVPDERFTSGHPSDSSVQANRITEVAVENDAHQVEIDANVDEREVEFDPYSPLDPNDPGSFPPQPFKKLQRIPRKPRVRSIAIWAPQYFALDNGLLTLPAPSTGLLFPEFNYALRHTQQEEAKIARLVTSRKKQKQKTIPSVFTLADAQAAINQETTEVEDEEGDANDGPLAEFFGGDDGGMGMDDYENNSGGGGDDAEGAAWDSLFSATGDDAPSPNMDALASMFGDGISYEDLCRAYVENLINTAAAAEVQTELAARVSTWRTKMSPVLEEEDARPEFDIHTYGERIINGLDALCTTEQRRNGKDRGHQNFLLDTSALDFGHIVLSSQLQNGYDVPRLFSSMLQLVNNGNLRITKINDSSDNFRITLLSTELTHQRIMEYKGATTTLVGKRTK